MGVVYCLSAALLVVFRGNHANESDLFIYLFIIFLWNMTSLAKINFIPFLYSKISTSHHHIHFTSSTAHNLKYRNGEFKIMLEFRQPTLFCEL